MRPVILLFIACAVCAAPKKYGNSKYWKTIQLKAANVYAADVGVPVCVGKTSMGEVIATASRSDGQDIVITNAAGVLIPREITSFSKTDSTFQMWYKDPATSATTGGTVVYVQWGGVVNVSDDATTWADCYGGSTDHALVVHGEAASANLIDASGNYTATDANITYAQTGKILKAPEFNGNNSSSSFGDITQLNSAQKLTFICWISQDIVDISDIIFEKFTDANNKIELITSTEGTGQLNFRIHNGGSTPAYIAYVDSGFSAATYYMLSFVYDGTQSTNATKLKYYLDKTQKTLSYTGTLPTTSANLSGQNFYIGYTSVAFDGKIDEFRIVAGALTANQISCQYDIQNGFATNATLTIGGTHLFNDSRGDVYYRRSYYKWPYQNDAYKKRVYY